MKNHQLKALVQVADSGSIRAAARTMNLCQSALTKALRELEEELGVELLMRSYKGVEFTDAGHTLLSRARLALAILDKAQEEIALQRGGAGVRVSIALTPLVGICVFHPNSATHNDRNPPPVTTPSRPPIPPAKPPPIPIKKPARSAGSEFRYKNRRSCAERCAPSPQPAHRLPLEFHPMRSAH